MALLNRQEILTALKELAHLAQAEGCHIELVVVGGALMALAYHARSATRDVDVLITAPEERALVRQLAERVAESLELPKDWLNDAVKGYFVGVSEGCVLLDLPGLLVKAPAVEQVLAMKLCAWRQDVDIEDALFLLKQMIAKGNNRKEIWMMLESYLIKGSELKAKYAFDDLWNLQNDQT